MYEQRRDSLHSHQFFSSWSSIPPGISYRSAHKATPTIQMFLPFSRMLLRFDRVTPSEVYFLEHHGRQTRSLQLGDVLQHHR